MSNPNTSPGLRQYQDHFKVYPEAPTSTLEPIERRVDGPDEHAIGARAIRLYENQDIIADEQFEIRNHRRKAAEFVDAVPAWDSVKYMAKFQEKPYPGLRKFINRLDKQDDYKTTELEVGQKKVQKELARVRDEIDAAPDEVKNSLGNFIMSDASPYISALYEMSRDEEKESGVEPPTPLEWLLEDSEAGDARLVNLLKYSVHNFEKVQDNPRRNHLMMQEKRQWAVGVHKGINEGWLHQDADAVSDRMQHLVVRYGDRFDLSAKHRGGYSYRGDTYIVLGKDNKDITYAAKHEMNHALLGSFEHTWLNEAVTEHLAQVLSDRRDIEDIQSDTTDYQQLFPDHSYRTERDLLSDLIAMTKGRVKMSDVTKAYSTGEVEDTSAFEDLEAKFDSALGVNFSLTQIQIHIEQIQDRIISEGCPRQRALHEASRIARSDLLQQPELIFDHPYKQDTVAA